MMDEKARLIITAIPESQIRRRLLPHFPFILVAEFLTYGLVFFAFNLMLDGWIKPVAHFIVAMTVFAPLMVLGSILFFHVWLRPLMRSRIELADGHLAICAGSSGGMKERHYSLGDIASIGFGQPLHHVEHFVKVGSSNDLKQGRLRVRKKDGSEDIYNGVDKVFDAESLANLARELMTRGITVTTSV